MANEGKMVASPHSRVARTPHLRYLNLLYIIPLSSAAIFNCSRSVSFFREQGVCVHSAHCIGSHGLFEIFFQTIHIQ